MRKYFNIYIIIVLFLTTGIFLNAERIINNDVVIQINKDKSITVNEKIEYEFDNLKKRGIFRDIPLRSEKNGGEIGRSLIKMNKITKNGVKEKYTEEMSENGIRYKIGRKNVFIDKLVNVYEINYTMPNEIPEKDGVYQIYFNAIGQFWPITIENATVTIKFPEGHSIEKNEILKFEVYTGAHGEKSDNYEIVQDEGEIKIKIKAPLPERNGLTFLMHTDTKKISPTEWDTIKLNYYLEPIKFIGPGIIILLLLYCIGTWIKFGKNLKRQKITPDFNPPKDMSAMFISCFESKRKNRKIDNNKMLSVGILSLLSKGYINIKNTGTDKKTEKYYLNEFKVKDLKDGGDDDLPYPESEVLKLLKPGEKMFSNKIYAEMRKISNLYDKEYEEEMYDRNTPLKISVMFISIFFSFMTLIATASKNVIPLTFMISAYIVVISSMVFTIFINKSLKKYILGEIKKFDGKMKIVMYTLPALFLLASLIVPGMRGTTAGIILVSLSFGIVLVVYRQISKKRNIVKTIFGILGILLYLLMMFYTKNGIYSVVAFVVYMIYSRLMIEKFTEKGMKIKEIIDGMKMYIRTSEVNQMKKFNDVEELISSFRTILPFAMAIGVENEALKLMQKTYSKNNLSAKSNLRSNRFSFRDDMTMEDLRDIMMAKRLLNEVRYAYTSSRKIYLYQENFLRSSSSWSGGSYSSGGGSFSSGDSDGGGFSGGGSGGGGGGSW